MQVAWNWTELCGPNDFVPLFRPGYVLSVCAEMTVIRLPILFSFLLTSTYYCSNSSGWIFRTRRENNVLCCRIIISSILSILPVAQIILEIYKFSQYPIENLVLIIQCFTWLTHTIYILCLRHYLGTSIRGPTVMIISWVLCFLSSIVSLRSTFTVFIQSTYLPILQVRLWFTIFNWMLQMFYLLTMFFNEDFVRTRNGDRFRFLAQVNISIYYLVFK